jgi:hypothetical protein
MPRLRTDLWPASISGPEVIAPVTILREQAALLGKKTNGLVLASVRTTATDSPTRDSKTGLRRLTRPGQASDNGSERFIHSFQLVVPALEDYTYTLFRVEHGIEFYPVKLDAPRALGRTAKSEEEFINSLRKILSSENTQRIIGSLIAQVETA